MADLVLAPGTANPFFLQLGFGKRFCIFHRPARSIASTRGMLYVHAFGEEMNKSRRMAAMQSRRLAASGYSVLQIDLYGCGDSDGEFLDARWEIWKDDVRAALAWLRERAPGGIGLWGARLGGSLAVEVARDSGSSIEELLLWQPVVAGDAFLTQFLRLHLAAQMLSEGAASTGVHKLRETLARGAPLEIAGYELHPDLAAAIGSTRLVGLPPPVNRVHWLEVSAMSEPKITPASARVVESWRASGVEVRDRVVHGEPFWSTLEIADCVALLEATDVAVATQRGLP
jgi:exosortase A-associated hydrolase 2